MPAFSFVNNKDKDQSVHLLSLINDSVDHCFCSINSLVSISEITRLNLASLAEQANLSFFVFFFTCY